MRNVMPISDEERLKRLEDSHSELKEGQLKMEYAMDTLITKVSDMAEGIGVMSRAVSKNAATSEVIKRVEDEVIENRQAIRKLEERYDGKLEEQAKDCDARGKERLSFGLKLALGATSALWAVTTFLFGYLYLDNRTSMAEVKSVNKTINQIPVTLEKMNSKITVLENKISSCSSYKLKAINEK